VWHWSDAVHTTGVPVHAPLWHVPPVSHRFPVLQLVPFGAVGFEQTPVAGLQVPTMPHGPDAVQVTPAHRFGLDTSDPKPSWQVMVAPLFMTTCAAASAPVNCDVLTVTCAFVARTSASIFTPLFRLRPDDESK
jgi:hypothetical protein